jgi:integrase
MSQRIPKYRLHKATGQACVRLNGVDHYLGKHATKASREKYHRLVGEWIANGRTLPKGPEDLSVAELVLQFVKFAEGYYGGSERENLRYALRPLVRLYGRAKAVEFGPRAFRAIRQALIEGTAPGSRKPAARTHANKQMARIRSVFRWGAGRELIPASVFHALQAVESLRKGRTEALERTPVMPVPMDQVDAVLPFVSRQVSAMIRLQLLTAARPGEICAVRPCEIDRSGDVWVYGPAHHKTQHHGHERRILLGPKAQEVLRPFLLRDAESFCFSPAEAETERRRQLHEKRTTPPSCGNRPGTNRVRKPRKTPGNVYDVNAYQGRARRRPSREVRKRPGGCREGRDTARHICLHAHGSAEAQGLPSAQR